MAAKGIQFPWRWSGGTIFPDLDVIWGMSVIYQFDRLGIKEDRVEALKWLNCLGR